MLVPVACHAVMHVAIFRIFGSGRLPLLLRRRAFHFSRGGEAAVDTRTYRDAAHIGTIHLMHMIYFQV